MFVVGQTVGGFATGWDQVGVASVYCNKWLKGGKSRANLEHIGLSRHQYDNFTFYGLPPSTYVQWVWFNIHICGLGGGI